MIDSDRRRYVSVYDVAARCERSGWLGAGSTGTGRAEIPNRKQKTKTTPPWDPRSVLLFAAGLAADYTVHGAADIHPVSMIPDFPAWFFRATKRGLLYISECYRKYVKEQYKTVWTTINDNK